MRKLKLEIDALRVQSFTTTADPRPAAGTVRGHNDGLEPIGGEVAIITDPRTREASCFGTCKVSCWGTCDASCGGTCEVSCGGACSDLCSLGCTDGCTRSTCPSGVPYCCV